jgi:hypothetical protein
MPWALHSRDDLQVKYVAANYRVTQQQVHPSLCGTGGIGSTCRPGRANMAEMMLRALAEEEAAATRRELVTTE